MTSKETRAPRARRSLLPGSTSEGTNVSISTSTRQGTVGVGRTIVRDAHPGTYTVSEAVSRAIAGCLSGPRPSSPIRTRATPGRRTSSGQNVSRESVTTAVPVPPPETAKRLYAARAGTDGVPGAPTIHPSPAPPAPPAPPHPCRFRTKPDRAVEPDERGARVCIGRNLLADDLDAVGREDE